jgi:hypothetical protein
MTYADRLNRWNRWFDGTPDDWHAHIVLWPLVLAGFINMQLSIASGFPFGVLVLLALLWIASIRLPYTRGWIVPGPDPARDEGARLVFGRADWIYDINERYEAMPDDRRFFVIPAILIVAGTLNLWLTFEHGWVFGGLFLLVLLVVLAVRAPYVWGVIAPPEKVTESPLLSAWLHDINRAFDDLPRETRFWTSVAVLGLVCIVDLPLASGIGVPLLLLFAIEFLALILVRAPYLSGMLDSPNRRLMPAREAAAPLQIAAEAAPPLNLAAPEMAGTAQAAEA